MVLADELVEAAPIRRAIAPLRRGKHDRSKHALKHECQAIVDVPPIELVEMWSVFAAGGWSVHFDPRWHEHRCGS